MLFSALQKKTKKVEKTGKKVLTNEGMGSIVATVPRLERER